MSDINQEELTQNILARLAPLVERLRSEFQSSISVVGVRYCVIDDLLPREIAERIEAAFPRPDEMRLMNTFREKKFTSKSYNNFNPILRDVTFALQDSRVIKLIETITGIENQIPDGSLYAGGLSAMGKGHFLGPHIDNSHDGDRRYYRTLNLLYYVTSDWTLDNGGNLELWDKKVVNKTTIVSRFNRLVVMETTPVSWHSVSEVKVNIARKCVSNYYFSPTSPTGSEYFNVTSFSAGPDQPVRRAIAKIDNILRQALRKLAPHGLGKKDIYSGAKR